jgi:transcriptional regulator with GAF, ATPase, and Fis domain
MTFRTHPHRLAETTEPVLILGASGTGKEFLAKTIHALSKRKNSKMITVNCGGLNDETLSSELFGHKKGAFTGAHRDKKGAIELAQDSTLFLDEIGDMPVKAQIALLRFLNDGTYQRFGESGKDREGNARIICATNQNLSQKGIEDKFREDLYHRINVFTIKIPSIAPLNKQRAETAFKTFLDAIAEEHELKIKGPLLTENAFEKLSKYNYHGNYREMKNILRYALVKSNG